MNYIIAHRGNTCGPSNKENAPEHIDNALAHWHDAEIDVWYIKGQFWLGHDEPTYEVSEAWLTHRKDRLWCHAKSIESLAKTLEMDLHCFWHDQDDYTITSKGYVWAYPGKPASGDKCIAVMPEAHDVKYDLYGFHMICSDYANLAK